MPVLTVHFGESLCQTSFYGDFLTGAAPLEAPGLVSFLGYAVSKSTGVNQTLETVRFGVSNVPGGLLGHEIALVGSTILA